MKRGALCKSLKHLLERRLYHRPDADASGLGADVFLRRHLYPPVRILLRERLIHLPAAYAYGLMYGGGSGIDGCGRIWFSGNHDRIGRVFRRRFRNCGSILLRWNDGLFRLGGGGWFIRLDGIRGLDGRFRLNRFVFRLLLLRLGRRGWLHWFLRLGRLLYCFLLCGNHRLLRTDRIGSLLSRVYLTRGDRLFRGFRVVWLRWRIRLSGRFGIGWSNGGFRIYRRILRAVLPGRYGVGRIIRIIRVLGSHGIIRIFRLIRVIRTLGSHRIIRVFRRLIRIGLRRISSFSVLRRRVINSRIRLICGRIHAVIEFLDIDCAARFNDSLAVGAAEIAGVSGYSGLRFNITVQVNSIGFAGVRITMITGG